MMRAVVLACGMMAVAAPAAAFERMLRSDCRVAFERLAEMVEPGHEQTPRMANSMRVTPDGWCQMKAGDPGFEDADFETFEWRAEGISRWIREGIPPLALQVRVEGLEPDQMQNSARTNRPDLRVEVTLRQIPNAGQLIVERAVMENGAGDRMLVSGVFERVFLGSEAMMQVSMGSIAFKAGVGVMTLDGTHENPFAFNIDAELRGDPQAQREAAFEAISRLPRGVFDDATRAELSAYAGDLPAPVGTLEVQVDSERGLGLMQIGMSAYLAFSSFMSEDENAAQLEVLFDGVTVSADWSPAAQVAD